MSSLNILASAFLLPAMLGHMLVVTPAEAKDPVKAEFLGAGTYAMKNGGCEKLEKIAGGGPKNVGSTPETLTADGFATWETGCSFASIKELAKGQKWKARMACNDEAGEISYETDIFEKKADGSFKVTNEGKTTHFVLCDGAKGK